MQLRNMFPSIARGKIQYHPVAGNNYICIITKTYNDEKITIVFNLDSFEQSIKLDLKTLGASTIVGELCANHNEIFLKGDTLYMPPYSIAILK